jgi:hypothetical protein
MARLFISLDTTGEHSLYRKGIRNIPCKTTTLDDYLKHYSYKVDVIKMDIEGGEMKALAGMTEVLKANSKLILFTEFNLKGFPEGVTPYDFISFLRNRGFTVYKICEEPPLFLFKKRRFRCVQGVLVQFSTFYV